MLKIRENLAKLLVCLSSYCELYFLVLYCPLSLVHIRECSNKKKANLPDLTSMSHFSRQAFTKCSQ